MTPIAASDWYKSAACRTAAPHPAHADEATAIEELKAVCRTCPVTADCLRYALDNRPGYGIWGGLTPQELAAATRESPPSGGHP